MTFPTSIKKTPVLSNKGMKESYYLGIGRGEQMFQHKQKK